MASSIQLGFAALEKAAASKRALIAQMVPLARRLAMACGSEGVTISDLRVAAEKAGFLTGRERGRELSFLGAVMRSAGLHATGEYRRSTIPQSHGNLMAVWRP